MIAISDIKTCPDIKDDIQNWVGIIEDCLKLPIDVIN